MSIAYKFDVLKRLQDKGYTTYKLRTDKILSQSTIECLRDKKPISFDTLDKLCKIFDLQPSDIIEYIPDTIPDSDGPIPPEMAAEFVKDNPKQYQEWFINKYQKK